MVLEQIYSPAWIKKKARYAFMLGLSYSVLGIAVAIFLFPEDSGIVSVALTSLILLPSIIKIFSVEEKKEKEKFSLTSLFSKHSNIFRVYFFIFLGVFFTYAFFSVVFPAEVTRGFFAEQIKVVGPVGLSAGSSLNFQLIFANNLKILVFCLLLSFIYGSGAIFLITWNASVWGTVIGMIAKNSALAINQEPFICAIMTMLAISPHMITEASSYFLAAISGGIISKSIIKEKEFSSRFSNIINDAIIIFVIAAVILILAAYLEAYITPLLTNFVGCLN